MTRKEFWAVIVISVMSLLTAGCYAQAPEKSDTCSGIPNVNVIPVSYQQVERAGLIYDLTAYLLTASCNPVAFVDPNLKITTVVTNDLGQRIDPVNNSNDKGSPWKELAFIPLWPQQRRFHIQLIAEANVTREDVAKGDVEWVACAIFPRIDKAPSSLDIDELINGHGVAECNVGM